MDKQKLASFAFGITGLDLDKLLEGLGISEKLERQEIQKAVNDFEKYILARHGDNPSYDDIARFWKENQVFEELVRIRYSLDSKYGTYKDFKNHLIAENSPQSSNDSLLFELIDELNEYLVRVVQESSTLSKSELATHNSMHERTLSELNKLRKDIGIESKTYKNAVKSKKEKLVINLSVIDNKVRLSNFKKISSQLNDLCISKDIDKFEICIVYDYNEELKRELNNIKELIAESNDYDFNELTLKEAKLISQINAHESFFKKILKCINIYFNNKGIQDPNCGFSNALNFQILLDSLIDKATKRERGIGWDAIPINVENPISVRIFINESTVIFLNDNYPHEMQALNCHTGPIFADMKLSFLLEKEGVNIISRILLFLASYEIEGKKLHKNYYNLFSYVIGPS